MTENGVETPEIKKDSTYTMRRRMMIIACVIVVTLGVTAGFALPQVIHSQRVAEYTKLTDELRTAMNVRADAETALQAAQALTHAFHAEALSTANAVSTLSEAKEPILPREQTKLLGDMSLTVADAIGPLQELEENIEEIHTLLIEAYVEAKESEGNDGGEEEKLPGSIAEVTIPQAIQLIATPVLPETVLIVADEEVTTELIENLKSSISSVTKEIKQLDKAINAELDRHSFFSETVMTMLPPLQETAAAIDEYLEAVEKKAAKAKADAVKNTAIAAEKVREIADSEDVSLLHSSIASYISASKVSLASHEEVVKAEKEAEAKKRSKKSSSDSGWASDGLCNYWSPMGGGMYMAPC